MSLVGQPILAAAGFPAGVWTRWKARPQARLPAPHSSFPHELLYSHMPAPIFISYARRTSQAEARALKAQLGDLAFLDESGIETREQFAKVIAKSLMEARLAVVFADDTYFDRPYCRWEWSLILRAHGTDHVYVTVPPGSTYALDALPPDLRTRNWSTPDLPAVLRAHLKRNPPLIGSLIAEQDRDYLLESRSEEHTAELQS